MEVAGVSLAPALAVRGAPHEREHRVDRTPRITTGMSSGPKKKNVLPENELSVRPPIVIVGTASMTPRKRARRPS
jgi:hypothetical protein